MPLNCDAESLYFCGDDLMGRGKYAQNLKKIITECHNFPKSNDNKSYVIGINAPWGSGKTYFVSMLKNYLEGKWKNPNLNTDEIIYASKNTCADIPTDDEVIPVVYYDAWKNDFWDNAFEPLFDQLIKAEAIRNETETKEIIDLGKSAVKIIALTLKGVFNKQIENVFDTDVLNKMGKEFQTYINLAQNATAITEEFFPEYTIFCEAIQRLKEYLEYVVKNTGKIVIMIDELDRCKPTFAVQTLEIVKHLFNIDGIIYVFSLDINELSHSVKVVYGNDFDATGYLGRFFNYISILPHGTMTQVIEYYYKEFHIDIARVEAKKSFEEIANIFCLSLRDLRTILCNFYVLQKTALKKYMEIPDALILYFYFLVMKFKKSELFSDAVFDRDSNQIIHFLDEHPIPFVMGDHNVMLALESAIKQDVPVSSTKFLTFRHGKQKSKEELCITKILDDTVIFKNGKGEILDKFVCFSGILYEPDLYEYDNIKNFRTLEYIYRQLELCDFLINI